MNYCRDTEKPLWSRRLLPHADPLGGDRTHLRFIFDSNSNLANHSSNVCFIGEKLFNEPSLNRGNSVALLTISREPLQMFSKRRFVCKAHVIQMRQLLEHRAFLKRPHTRDWVRLIIEPAITRE